jgi:general secretion pathway protein G
MRGRGFTLIELLIVIAIILILIAIALPNFLEAQIRARVTKAKAELRTLATANETYWQDFNQYPPMHDPDQYSPAENGLYQLTTPLTYLKQLPTDPFSIRGGLIEEGDEIGWETASTGRDPIRVAAGARDTGNNNGIDAYVLTSHGPNQRDDFGWNDNWPYCVTGTAQACGGDLQGWINYSPTNGTKSGGEIVKVGGEWRNGNYCIDQWNHIVGKGKRI